MVDFFIAMRIPYVNPFCILLFVFDPILYLISCLNTLIFLLWWHSDPVSLIVCLSCIAVAPRLCTLPIPHASEPSILTLFFFFYFPSTMFMIRTVTLYCSITLPFSPLLLSVL